MGIAKYLLKSHQPKLQCTKLVYRTYDEHFNELETMTLEPDDARKLDLIGVSPIRVFNEKNRRK